MENVARAYAEQAGYTFHERVGAGAFKETYRVSDANGSFALKVLGKNCSTARTEREIEALTRCSHENIARLKGVSDFLFEGGIHRCFVEDYLAGGTLGKRLEAGLYTPEQGKVLGLGLIFGVQHLHGLDLVHRDIKPENVMYASAGDQRPILVDFGLVRDLAASSITQSWIPQGPGTPLFASPEQLNNRKELIDWRSDQFSIAVTISFSVFGYHPHSLASDGSYECVERVASGQESSTRFKEAAQAAGFGVLEQMVRPYPVQRLRTPEVLLSRWEGN